MIRKLFVFMAVVFMAVACSSEGYVIKGEISGDSEGKTVYLYKGVNFYKVPADSAVIKNGKFEFNGKLTSPDLYTIMIFPDDKRGMMNDRGYAFRPAIPVFLDKGTITIRAALEKIPLESLDGSYDYSNIEITSPRTNELYMNYTQKQNVLGEKRLAAWKKYSAYLNGKKKAPVSEGIRAVTEIDEAGAALKQFIKEFISQNKDHVVGMYVFRDNLDKFSVAEIDDLVTIFPLELKNGEYGQQVMAEADRVKKTAEGSKYVDYTLQDIDGNTLKLSDYVGKGKYVLLEFWASWCGPCKADIPHLKEVYELYHPEGFEVISISMDNDKGKWLQEVEKQQMTWLQASDLKAFEGELSKIYNFQGIPACVLVGPDGTIVDRNMRGSWMDRKLIELYGNKFGDKY